MPATFAILIPARFASHRYPGKPLASLRGADGHFKSLIQRTWETATAAVAPERCWVATDDERVADAAKAFGAQVVMTPPECRNGTERCAAALDILGDVAPILINLQGDAPLTPPHILAALAEALEADPSASVATPALGCSSSLYLHLLNDQKQGRVGGTTLVFNTAQKALYFSKRVIPHVPDEQVEAHEQVHLHLGVYAYRPKALRDYAAFPPSALEQVEGLEQLRFFDMDRIIRVVRFAPLDWNCIELNNPEDVPLIEAALMARGIA